MSSMSEEIIDSISQYCGTTVTSSDPIDFKTILSTLDIDSLDLMEIVMWCEIQYKCQISDAALEEVKTVGQFIDLVKREATVKDTEDNAIPLTNALYKCRIDGINSGAVTVKYVGSDICVVLEHSSGKERAAPLSAFEFYSDLSDKSDVLKEMSSIIANSVSYGTINAAIALYDAGFTKSK